MKKQEAGGGRRPTRKRKYCSIRYGTVKHGVHKPLLYNVREFSEGQRGH